MLRSLTYFISMALLSCATVTPQVIPGVPYCRAVSLPTFPTGRLARAIKTTLTVLEEIDPRFNAEALEYKLRKQPVELVLATEPFVCQVITSEEGKRTEITMCRGLFEYLPWRITIIDDVKLEQTAFVHELLHALIALQFTTFTGTSELFTSNEITMLLTTHPTHIFSAVEASVVTLTHTQLSNDIR